jgi:hypothetical protein
VTAAERGRGLRFAAICCLLGLLLRLVLAVWGYHRFPPVADGFYYHEHAVRLAEGLGYSTNDADGSSRAVAHYPVGYPALLALSYWSVEHAAGVGMLMNAVVGGAFAALLMLAFARSSHPSAGWLAATSVSWALHPALILYTPALMTEAFTAALYAGALATLFFALRRPALLNLTLLGLLGGVGTLVRPQFLLFALVCAVLLILFSEGSRRARWLRGLLPLGVSLAAVLPWTYRNCEEMDRCALVSMNGGWNLLIGTNAAARGTWAEVVVPDECSTLTVEAEVDLCFERVAKRRIAEAPGAYLALIPSKLSRTFDYAGAGPWYLNASNPDAFSSSAKLVAGALETLWIRLSLLAALTRLGAALRIGSATQRWTSALLLCAVPWATPAVLVFGVLSLLPVLQKRRDAEAVLLCAAGALVLLTALTHAVFFGAGRYALMVLPAFAVAMALGGPRDVAQNDADSSVG